MKLKWLGHSCFLLTSEKGVRVLMDPYNSSIGLAMPGVEADIVTISHNHRDHNNKDAVKGPFKLLDKPGRFEKDGVGIIGVLTAHDDRGGAERGNNIIFKVSMDGVNVCHCGDLGHLLTPQQIKEIGPVDVLLIPIGGFYTIDARVAAEVIKQIGPKVTIPMHYKVEGLVYDVQGVEPFANTVKNAKNIDSREVELKPDDLKKFNGVLVLAYK
jgi:L-ascorbate metabolism protein UlaG (beta-lactamase superfamily)